MLNNQYHLTLAIKWKEKLLASTHDFKKNSRWKKTFLTQNLSMDNLHPKYAFGPYF